MRLRLTAIQHSCHPLGGIQAACVLVALLTACGSVETAPIAGITFVATTTVTAAPSIHVEVTATNQGHASVPYEGNTCGAVRFALYDTTTTTDSIPVWKEPGVICLMYSAPRVLKPGETVKLGAVWPTGNPDWDGAPPPAGTYAVKATVGFSGTEYVLDAGVVTIAP